MDAILKKLARYVLRYELLSLRQALEDAEQDVEFYRDKAERRLALLRQAEAELDTYRTINFGGTD